MMTLRPTKDVMKSGIFYLSNSLRGVREALEKSFVEITIIYEIEKELQAICLKLFLWLRWDSNPEPSDP